MASRCGCSLIGQGHDTGAVQGVSGNSRCRRRFVSPSRLKRYVIRRALVASLFARRSRTIRNGLEIPRRQPYAVLYVFVVGGGARRKVIEFHYVVARGSNFQYATLVGHDDQDVAIRHVLVTTHGCRRKRR